MDDDRVTPRIGVDAAIFVEVGVRIDPEDTGEIVICNSMDISDGGLQLVLDEGMATGQIVRNNSTTDVRKARDIGLIVHRHRAIADVGVGQVITEDGLRVGKGGISITCVGVGDGPGPTVAQCGCSSYIVRLGRCQVGSTDGNSDTVATAVVPFVAFLNQCARVYTATAVCSRVVKRSRCTRRRCELYIEGAAGRSYRYTSLAGEARQSVGYSNTVDLRRGRDIEHIVHLHRAIADVGVGHVVTQDSLAISQGRIRITSL